MSALWRHLTLAAALPVLATVATAQTPSSNGANSGSLGNAHTYDRPDSILGGYDPSLSHRQFVARRQEAHNRMVDNANRLLMLTRELQESVHLHEPTASDARSLDDIAKLARAVRDGMRQ